MLRVKTYIDSSLIHGIGLFAAEVIEPGTIIWDFDYDYDQLLSPDFRIDNDIIKSFIEKYSYRDGCLLVLCGDNARFMNHDLLSNTSNGNGRETIANKRIEIGEEITCNYYEIDDDAKNKIEV